MREMLRIAGPTVATMSSFTLMQFTDKWLCSHIGPEPVYVGAQGNGGLVSWVLISIAHGIVTIVNTFTSQNLGAGKPERGASYAWNAAWIALLYWVVVLLPFSFVLGSVFRAAGVESLQSELATEYGRIILWGACVTLFGRAFAQYFYGMHRAGVVLAAGVSANVVNVLLSAVLVFGPEARPELGMLGRAAAGIAELLGTPAMGVAGSAWGTVLAALVEAALPLCVFLSPALHRAYATRSAWKPSGVIIKDLLRLGWSQGVMFGSEMICWGFFMVYLVSGYGPHHATAGWIAHQYMSLSFMPVVGISVAVTALVGKYQGMGRSDLAQNRAWLGVRISLIYMGVCGLVFAFFPRQLVGLFIERSSSAQDVEQLLHLGRNFLLATAAFQLFDAVAMTLSGALRGAGDTTVPGVLTVICAWGIIVGGGLALRRLAPGLESTGGWIAAATYICVLSIVLTTRFASGRWKSIRLVKDDVVAA
jgi:MATE family multidrug resistance protein